ncbi:hypothetical protein RCL1_002163 [Eukaryota sp. TZLM3-RCL]
MGLKLRNFYGFHVASFFFMTIVGAVLIHYVEGKQAVDCFFMASSAVTDTGLTSFNFEITKLPTQIIVISLVFLGSYLPWTLVPVVIRRNFLIQNFNEPIGHDNPCINEDESSPLLKKVPLYTHSMEYLALTRLLIVVFCYVLFFYFFGFITIGLRFYFSLEARQIAQEVGGCVWFTIFHVISAFTNAGVSLFASSLEPFRHDYFILIPISILILSGQAFFPIFLRLVIFQRSKTSKYAPVHNWLLDHGRQVYTHLFSSIETKFLLFWNITFFIVQFSGFFIFDQDNLPGDLQTSALNAYFMTVSTRVTGFSTINLSKLSEPMLVMMILLQVFAAAPFLSALRRSAESVTSKKRRDCSGVFHAIRRAWRAQQTDPFGRDIFWLYSCFFLVTLSVYERLSGFMFHLLYEVSSAYGNIGLSLGWPTVESSFATVCGPLGKFVIALIMLAGRHRNLPASIDKAVNTTTFEGLAEEVLDILPKSTLDKMGIRQKSFSNAKVARIHQSVALVVGAYNDETVHSNASCMTFPPKLTNRDLKKYIQKKNALPSISLVFGKKSCI